VEHPSQAIVEYCRARTGASVAAGLKVWDDDWTGEIHATLYLPGLDLQVPGEEARARIG
jgi:hypothetical protein